MESLFWAVLLKPLVAALFFCFVYCVAWCFWKLLPPGRVKTALFSPVGKKSGRRSHWSSEGAQ